MTEFQIKGILSGAGGVHAMEQTDRNSRLLRWVIAAAAVVMIGIGLWNGENRIVLAKAVQICLECIGIG